MCEGAHHEDGRLVVRDVPLDPVGHRHKLGSRLEADAGRVPRKVLGDGPFDDLQELQELRGARKDGRKASEDRGEGRTGGQKGGRNVTRSCAAQHVPPE